MLDETLDYHCHKTRNPNEAEEKTDVYFSADVETDGPIPGPFSMLSFALVYAGRFDGTKFEPPGSFDTSLYLELKPISESFQPEALRINGLDRDRLALEGANPEVAMAKAARWIDEIAGPGKPVIVSYPLCFDWTWLYWYFMRYLDDSPFSYSRCFDIKTAYAVKAQLPITDSSRSRLLPWLQSSRVHTHNALDDAIEQAEIFVKLFKWDTHCDSSSR
jgi:hypothetical protein